MVALLSILQSLDSASMWVLDSAARYVKLIFHWIWPSLRLIKKTLLHLLKHIKNIFNVLKYWLIWKINLTYLPDLSTRCFNLKVNMATRYIISYEHHETICMSNKDYSTCNTAVTCLYIKIMWNVQRYYSKEAIFSDFPI